MRHYASLVGTAEAMDLSDQMVQRAIDRIAAWLAPSDGRPMTELEKQQLMEDERRAAMMPKPAQRSLRCAWCGRVFVSCRERIYCGGDCKRKGYRRKLREVKQREDNHQEAC